MSLFGIKVLIGYPCEVLYFVYKPMMPQQISKLVLDLLFLQQPVPAEQVNSLSENQWKTIMSIVKQHRLGPLLYWRLKQEQKHLLIPEDIQNSLSQQYKKSALRSLQLQRELIKLSDALSNANIPFIALKGAYLAFYAYPEPALRPMRDLDILVSKENVIRAYSLLLDCGYKKTNSAGDPQAYINEGRKHLAPISTPDNLIKIEIHLSISKNNNQNNQWVHDCWLRSINRNVANKSITFLSETDLLLNLIEHASYHHLFDNGPLIISDIANLIQTHVIDWKLFWQISENNHSTRGALLVLKTVNHYFAELPIQWPANTFISVPTDVIDSALLLSQQNITIAKAKKRLSILDGHDILNSMKVLTKKAFPSRNFLAMMYPVSTNSLKVYLYYPVNFIRLMTVTIRRLFQIRNLETTDDLTIIKQWLYDSDHH